MVFTKSAFFDSFSPFKNGNFRTYLLGQGISLIGTFMQQMALQWFIWDVTQDTRWVGIVAAVTFAPAFFLMPYRLYCRPHRPAQIAHHYTVY